MANKLTKSRGDGWEFVGFLPHIGQGWQFVLPQANGAKLISDDGKKAQLDTAEVAEAIEFGKKFVTRLGGVQAIDNWRIALPGGDNRAQGAALGTGDIFGQKQMAFINGGNWYADNIRRANRRLRAAAEVQRGPLPQRPPRPPRPEDQRLQRGHPGGGAQGRAEARSDVGVHEVHRHQGGRDPTSSATPRTSPRTRKRRAIPPSPATRTPGLGRKEFYALFEQGVGARTVKHPAVNEIRAEYNKVITSYLRDETLNVRDGLKEANRLAQQKIDEFWQQNPSAGQYQGGRCPPPHTPGGRVPWSPAAPDEAAQEEAGDAGEPGWRREVSGASPWSSSSPSSASTS